MELLPVPDNGLLSISVNQDAALSPCLSTPSHKRVHWWGGASRSWGFGSRFSNKRWRGVWGSRVLYYVPGTTVYSLNRCIFLYWGGICPYEHYGWMTKNAVINQHSISIEIFTGNINVLLFYILVKVWSLLSSVVLFIKLNLDSVRLRLKSIFALTDQSSEGWIDLATYSYASYCLNLFHKKWPR